MSSKCKTCGEAIAKTGNYTVRILPAKRVPKKARKLVKTMANDVDEAAGQQQSSIETNSFQKFLLKRARPTNIMELVCGKCGAISKIKMLKPSLKQKSKEVLEKKVKESDKNLMSPSMGLSSRKGKKKARDFNAGLTITLEASKTPSSSSPQQSNAEPNEANYSRKRQVSAFQKQKEMNSLKKALFHSKKAKKSGSSLQDFLSGI